MAGEQDANGFRGAAMDFREQGSAVHVRHAGVGHHQVHGPAFQQLQGLFAASASNRS